MVVLYRIVFAFLFLIFSSSSLACVCMGATPLVKLVELGQADHLIRAQVEQYASAGGGYPNSMTVKVIEVLRGSVQSESLVVYGDDGMSCSPFVTNYAKGEEWLIPMISFNGKFTISPCAPLVTVEENEVIGLASPPLCLPNREASSSCEELSYEDLQSYQQDRITLDQFKANLELYSDAVAWAIKSCGLPWPRCNHIRANYDSQTGELLIPAIDIQQKLFGGTENITTGRESWRLQLVEGTTDTYKRVKSGE